MRNNLLSNKISKIKQSFNAYQEKIQNYKKAIDNDIAENLNHKNKSYEIGLKKWLGDIDELHPIVRNGKKPKIFYHGSRTNNIGIFIPNSSDGFEKAIWLSPNKEVADFYGRFDGAVYEVYLKVKNPLMYNAKGKKYKEALPIILQQFKQDYKKGYHDAVVIKNILDGGRKQDTNILVFNPNQIKAVDNKGSVIDTKTGELKTARLKDRAREDFKYFNDKSPNIYHSNPHLGSGLVGGSVAGFEVDKEGNINFNPTNFLLGLGGGSIGSKRISKLYNNPKAKVVLDRIATKKAIIPLLQKGFKMDTQEVIRAISLSPQKGRDMIIIGKDNLNEEIIQYLIENNKKIAVDTLDEKTAKELGFKYPKVKRTISGYEIKHTINKHQHDEYPLTLNHIRNWINYTDNADKKVFTKDDLGQNVIVSAKQINGYYVVVESLRLKSNELAFKTMYFAKGNLQNNKTFKTANAL